MTPPKPRNPIAKIAVTGKVIDAAAKAMFRAENEIQGDRRTRWTDLTEDCQEDMREIARRTIVAAMRAATKH